MKRKLLTAALVAAALLWLLWRIETAGDEYGWFTLLQ